MRLEISELHHQLKTTMIYVTHDQVEAMTMADKIVVLNAGNVEQVGSPMDLYRNPKNLFVAGFIGSPKMNFIEGPAADKYGAKTIGVRPEHIKISTKEGDWKGKVGVAEHLGSDTFLHVHTDQGTINVRGMARSTSVMATPSTCRRWSPRCTSSAPTVSLQNEQTGRQIGAHHRFGTRHRTRIRRSLRSRGRNGCNRRHQPGSGKGGR